MNTSHWDLENCSTGSNPPPAEPTLLLDYYFLIRQGSRPLNEVKLILVGRGGVGKTCLIKRLMYDTFDENEPETPGIEIRNWSVILSHGEPVRLHVWDFGGQEILHAIHQFFLTERTLYLLVLSGREGTATADAEYWLQLINSFGGSSRVIIVLNKCAQHPFDVNRGLLSEKYSPSIADFVKTDCEVSETSVSGNSNAVIGIPDLKKLIIRETDLMEYRKADFPSDWFAIKERLAGMNEDFVTWEQYQEICRESGETGPQAQRDLAKHLHILGIALNYSDDLRLSDTRVLKPRWVTEGIYSLLRAGQKTGRNGVLTASDMVTALDPLRYPSSKHQFLWALMERFQLCFRLPGWEERYLVPELLDENQPDLSPLLRAPGLGFRYQYEVLPEGLLPRFIVQSHSHSEQNPHLRWRSGVVLERNGCRAVVRADARERRVDIYISGPDVQRRGLLEIIREKFEEQHRDLKGLTIKERAPLPDEPSVTVSYSYLLRLEDEGVKSWRPEGTSHEYRITDLLNGIESTESRARRRDPKIETRRVDPGILSPNGSNAAEETLMSNSKRDKVFISYSHKDHRAFEQLKTMLAPVMRSGKVDAWDDTKIAPGSKWKDEIESVLGTAKVAVLLVSDNFLASDFIAKHELPPLLKAAQDEGVTVFWIYLSSCLYKETEIAEYQAAHDVTKPLSQITRPIRQQTLRKICEKLVQAVQAP